MVTAEYELVKVGEQDERHVKRNLEVDRHRQAINTVLVHFIESHPSENLRRMAMEVLDKNLWAGPYPLFEQESARLVEALANEQDRKVLDSLRHVVVAPEMRPQLTTFRSILVKDINLQGDEIPYAFETLNYVRGTGPFGVPILEEALLARDPAGEPVAAQEVREAIVLSLSALSARPDIVPMRSHVRSVLEIARDNDPAPRVQQLARSSLASINTLAPIQPVSVKASFAAFALSVAAAILSVMLIHKSTQWDSFYGALIVGSFGTLLFLIVVSMAAFYLAQTFLVSRARNLGEVFKNRPGPIALIPEFGSRDVIDTTGQVTPITFVQGGVLHANKIQLTYVPTWLQQSIYDHEQMHLTGRNDFTAYFLQPFRLLRKSDKKPSDDLNKLKLEPEYIELLRILNRDGDVGNKRKAILNLVESSSLKLEVNNVKNQSPVSDKNDDDIKMWTGLLSEVLLNRLNKAVDETKERVLANEVRRTVGADLHRYYSGDPSDRGLFAGSLRAYYKDAKTQPNLQISVHYMTTADVTADDAKRAIEQAIRAASQTVEEKEFRNAFVLDAKTIQGLKQDKRFWDMCTLAVNAGRLLILEPSQAAKLSDLLQAMEKTGGKRTPFLEVREKDSATFRFLLPKEWDLSKFVDDSLRPDQLRFFLLLTKTLNPVVYEVEQRHLGELDKLEEHLKTGA